MRKRRAGSVSGVDQEGERKRTTADVSKIRRWHQNRGLFLSPGGVWGIPAYRPGGARHGGGASLVWASARNAGTCRLETVSGLVSGGERERPQEVVSLKGLSTGRGAQGRTVS